MTWGNSQVEDVMLELYSSDCKAILCQSSDRDEKDLVASPKCKEPGGQSLPQWRVRTYPWLGDRGEKRKMYYHFFRASIMPVFSAGLWFISPFPMRSWRSPFLLGETLPSLSFSDVQPSCLSSALWHRQWITSLLPAAPSGTNPRCNCFSIFLLFQKPLSRDINASSLYGSQVEACVKEALINLLNKTSQGPHILGLSVP